MKKPAWRAIIVLLAALAPFVPMLVRGEVPSFRDHRDFFVPLRAATAEALRSGELPLWNALSASGEPWLANPQTGVFYPPAWLVAVLPFEIGYVLFLALHLAIAGLGWRRLIMRWTRDDVATLSACGLILSGPILSLLDVSNSLASLAWMPLVLSFAFDARPRGAARDAAVIAMSFLGGEPLVALVGALLYASVRLLRERRAAVRRVAAVAAFSLLFCAMQLLPFLESLRGSDRSLGLPPEAALANSMAPLDWLRMPVSPLPPGARAMTVTSQRFLLSIFVTPILFLPACALLVLWKRTAFPRRACAGWMVVLASSLFLAAGSHLVITERAYLALGLAVNRFPAKFVPIGVLALVALASIAIEALLREDRRRARLGVIAVLAGASLSLLATSSYSLVTRLHLGAWLLVIVAVLLSPSSRSWVLPIVTLLVVADAIAASRFLLGSQPLMAAVAPYDALLRRDFKVIRLEQLDRRHDAVANRASREAWLDGYLNLRNAQADASTAAPVVDARYQVLLDVALSAPRIDVLDFLGVGYLLTTRHIDAPGYREVGSRDGVRIYERDGASPLVTVWENHVTEPDADAAFNAILNPSHDARRRIVVTGNAPERRADARDGPVGNCRVVATTWRSMRADVNSPRGGIAVVSQRMVSGWSVSVDGMAAEALLVNGIVRGVAVPPGRHSVAWRYAPRSLALGLLLSVTGITVAWITAAHRRGAGFP